MAAVGSPVLSPPSGILDRRAGAADRRADIPSLLDDLATIDRTLAPIAVDELPIGRVPEAIERLVAIERRAAALRVRLGHRMKEAGGRLGTGDRDVGSFLARVTGSSTGKAKSELALAERLESLPEVAQAYDEGRISTDQAQVLVGAAEANPATTGDLLAAAHGGSFRELRDLAARCERAARSEATEVERERRVHERRYCRTWTPAEGGLRLDAWITAVDGARLLAALTKRTTQLMGNDDDPPERLRADALVDLVSGTSVTTELLVRVDAGALVRGELDVDEMCEVEGVGPISVTAARSLLGDAFLTLLVTKGADVTTVTSTTRVVPRKVRKAVIERDRCCVVPGCGAMIGLEIDHWRLDFGKNGPTELDNLCRLCSVHHKMKHKCGWRILGGPGKWRWLPPRAGPHGTGP